MLTPKEIRIDNLGELKSEVLTQAKIELKMNLSLIDMLKGNTALEDLANLREECVEPLQNLVEAIETSLLEQTKGCHDS